MADVQIRPQPVEFCSDPQRALSVAQFGGMRGSDLGFSLGCNSEQKYKSVYREWELICLCFPRLERERVQAAQM